MDRYLDVRVEVATALATGRPVVALESTVFVHGLPRPINLETAAAMEEAVRAEGVVPATIGLLSGRAVIGLTGDEIAERLGYRHQGDFSRAWKRWTGITPDEFRHNQRGKRRIKSGV